MYIFTKLAAIFILSISAANAGEVLESVTVVNKLHESLLTTMKLGDKKSPSERYNLLEPIISQSFDFPKIARIVTGRHWKNASKTDQKHFKNSLLRLGTSSYISNFKEYSGHHFKVIQSTEFDKKAIVETALIDSEDNSIKIKYMLQKKESVWRIINVIAEGVSDLSIKRADYTLFLGSNSLGALAKTLNNKIQLSR